MSTSHQGPRKRLPVNPSLEHLKKQAKRKLRDLPEGSKLADAQHQLAHEYGCKSWRELTRKAEAMRQPSDSTEEIKAAILREDLNAIRALLDKHPELFTPALWPPTIFQAKSLAVTRLLLDRGLNPDECSAPRKPLHLAVYQCLADVVELLLAHGADASQLNPLGERPLDLLDAYEPRPAGDLEARRIRKALLAAGATEDVYCTIRAGDIARLGALLKANPALAALPPGDGLSPLDVAARSGRLEAARLLLDHGAPLEEANGLGNTALWFACQSPARAADRLEVARLFLTRGADPKRRCEDGSTPLHFAAWRGPILMVQLLLEHGADPHARDDKGQTPTEYASHVTAHPDAAATIAILGETGPTPADIFLDEVTPRPDSFHKSGSPAPAEKLLEKNPNLPAYSLAVAAAAADGKQVRAWLEKDASLASKRSGPRGWSPLLYLCFSRLLRDRRKPEADFAACAKLLLEHGANANDFFPESEASPHRETVLYGAAGIANSPAVTRVLLDAGAFVTDPPDGETLYHVSEFADNTVLRMILEHQPKRSSVSYCMCHKMDMEDPEGLRMFIEHGADVNVEIGGGVFKGYRPLHFALFRRRSLAVLRVLLDAGADPNLASAQGQTPLTLALRLGRKGAVDLLVARGAKPETDATTQYLAALAAGDAERAASFRDQAVISEKDHHLLVDAAEAGRLAAVRLMLAEGFPLHARGPSYGGWDGTALDHAAWRGEVEVVEFLLGQGANPRLKHSFGGDALGAAIHGASHGNHQGGPATVAALARHYQPGELGEYLKYAGTEANREVVEVLRQRAIAAPPGNLGTEN